MASSDYGLQGIGGNVRIGRRGPRVRNTSGTVQFRNTGDTAFARVQGADSVADDDFVTRRQLLAAGGALAGLPGAIYDSLQFYMDPSDRNSYPASGTSVTDIIGNATGGTLTNVVFADGAFEFDGSVGSPGSASFTKGSALDNVFSGGGTVIAFIRAADDGQANLGVVADTSNDTDSGWLMHTTGKAAGHIGVRFTRNFNSGTGGQWTSDTQVNPFNGQNNRVLHAGTWASWAVAYDDGSTTNVPTFYVNAINAPLSTTVAPLGSAVTDAGNPLRFGSTVNVSNPWTFDGQMGPILIFDRILSADEIAAVHNVFAQRFALGWRGMDGKLMGSGLTDMSGQDVVVRAGDSYSTTNSEAEGGDLWFLAGNHVGGGNAASGRVYMKSGSGGGNIGDAGQILIESGANGLGSGVTIRVGDQTTGNKPSDMTVRGADNLGTGSGGNTFIRSGAPTSTGTTGGLLTVRAADGNDAGGTAVFGGDAIFRAGDGVGRGGGDWTGRAGDGGSGSGGDWTARAGHALAGNGRGGHASMEAGDGSGNGSGGVGGGTVTIRSGSNTIGNNITAGNVEIFTGNNAGANFNGLGAGRFVVTTGSQTNAGSAANSPGGDAEFILGSSAKTATSSPGGSFLVTAGAGVANSANSRGGKVAIVGGAVTGTTAGAVAGDVELTGGGSPNAAGTAGSVILKGGTSNGGTHGKVSMQTADETTPIQMRTQAGFAGTDEEHLTVGVNTTLTPGTSVDLLTLGTLATAGHNYKFEVQVTGVDSASVDDQNQQAWIVTYYRNSTGINAYTADLSPGKHIASISGFSVDVDYSLVIVSNDIRLRATNNSSTATYVGLFAVKCVRQEGGFSS